MKQQTFFHYPGCRLTYMIVSLTHSQSQAGNNQNLVDPGFSLNNRRILTGSYDDHARLWDADSGALLWTSPVPFWNDSTLNRYDILAFALLVFLFGFFPTTKLFDPGRRLYLGRPNPYLHLYNIPGVERWLPEDSASRKPVESPAGEAET
uniref:Uncharacterized protein n=1 Tax=Candidatus Kentrum sp. MB TaxID=2138164 RepID=A0A451BDI4_9GAMM|nr:MAG: hypothetical protein BECKMB1821G_GA0114241_105121 [Candidatus Kentron sp. MB]VFK33735.1 MAG: hypothetical protein BECKMB1821I_GA0114274_105221 [Candidatus Kentron sp. MB]VFK76328.1 MAG: hypothetical protein BECKMB1821H_GA0114242_105121 [Candidatus Kentron sp. MB]